MITKEELEKLSKENLIELILEMSEFLSEDQHRACSQIMAEYWTDKETNSYDGFQTRMSDEFVSEKMAQIKTWMQEINEGELYLDVEEYEDYSDSYWDRDWITEYYDNQGIGDKLMFMIGFAGDCLNDRRYPEANFIYEWLWEMLVSGDDEYCDPAGLEELAENKIIRTDLKQLALHTLYADYQVQNLEQRAENIYRHFAHYSFRKLHIEEMFQVGREELPEKTKFWEDWITLLQKKSGNVESRLLQEAVLYNSGVKGLAEMADIHGTMHPSLYLAVMAEYDKKHDYKSIEEVGQRAMEKLDKNLVIRSEVAQKAAYAASCLMHTEKMMEFCWESFCSDLSEKNLLRLYGTAEMAEQYQTKCEELLAERENVKVGDYAGDGELERNAVSDDAWYTLHFYCGDFQFVKQASKNPHRSLGWSSRYIGTGIRLFLLYLYETPLPSKAAAAVAGYLDCFGSAEKSEQLYFERIITEESRTHKVSVFWNYFQRWKTYYPMSDVEKKSYLAWAEQIVYKRADAIVSGQYRRHYGEVAILLAIVAEIKEAMGLSGEKNRIFAEYKKKFPRHSAFQAEMKEYFGIKN